MLDDLLIRRLEHMLREPVVTSIWIIRVRHTLDLAQLAHRLSIRIPPHTHLRRSVLNFWLQLLFVHRVMLVMWDVVECGHIKFSIIIHQLICHSIYRLNQIYGLVFGERVCLQSIWVILTRVGR